MTRMNRLMAKWKCHGHMTCLSPNNLLWILSHHGAHWMNSKHQLVITFIKFGTFCHHQPHSYSCLMVHSYNAPSILNPLNTNVIQWHIPKDMICLLKLFGTISSSLVVLLQYNIKVGWYHFVERDPRAEETSMHRIMTL
jgi:hypothetical protein